MSDTILKVENLSKKFCRSLSRSMTYGTIDTLRSMVNFSYNQNTLRKDEFWALNNINFELKRGETLGLVGQNGCGKSTLLRVLNGIFPPDEGRVEINGRIGALIAVGAGFHPHMTGRENIYLNGTILGMKKRELDHKLKSIIDFAEIGDFIDAPVATYSSGMAVRLGFAIAIHSEPDILLVDEVLAVGDFNFQYKCYEKIKNLKQNGTGIIFVSHSDSSIKAVCSNGILLDKGKVVESGGIDDILDSYGRFNSNKIKQILIDKYDNRKLSENDFNKRRGNGKIRFMEVHFCDEAQKKIEKVEFGTQRVFIYAKYFAFESLEKVRVSFVIRDASKSDFVWVMSPLLVNNILENLNGEGSLLFELDIADLGPNIYGLYIVLTDHEIMDLAYDVWDVNGTLLEIESNIDLTKRGLAFAKPYLIKHTKLIHTT